MSTKTFYIRLRRF